METKTTKAQEAQQSPSGHPALEILGRVVLDPPAGTEPAAPACRIQLEPRFAPGLLGLGDFSHVLVLWRFDQAPWDGVSLVWPSPYRTLDHDLGVFATRGPFRPNGIALSLCRLLACDPATGWLELDWIDAAAGSPVLDIKPWHPSSDLPREAASPAWCAHWPRCREDAAGFDWAGEFTF